MAIDRERFIKECEFARLILKNTIANTDKPEMAANAKKILTDPQLFEKFVLNRIARKAAARVEVEQAPKTKVQAFGRVMTWLSFRR